MTLFNRNEKRFFNRAFSLKNQYKPPKNSKRKVVYTVTTSTMYAVFFTTSITRALHEASKIENSVVWGFIHTYRITKNKYGRDVHKFSSSAGAYKLKGKE